MQIEDRLPKMAHLILAFPNHQKNLPRNGPQIMQWLITQVLWNIQYRHVQFHCHSLFLFKFLDEIWKLSQKFLTGTDYDIPLLVACSKFYFYLLQHVHALLKFGRTGLTKKTGFWHIFDKGYDTNLAYPLINWALNLLKNTNNLWTAFWSVLVTTA